MGSKFNPLMLERVSQAVSKKDCFNALKEGRVAVIDNTSMIAEHRTIYTLIAKS